MNVCAREENGNVHSNLHGSVNQLLFTQTTPPRTCQAGHKPGCWISACPLPGAAGPPVRSCHHTTTAAPLPALPQPVGHLFQPLGADQGQSTEVDSWSPAPALASAGAAPRPAALCPWSGRRGGTSSHKWH